jgi:hypothetical protein
MLYQLVKLENWAKLAGFVLIFLSIIVCSFIYAISYPPLVGNSAVAEHAGSSAGPANDEQQWLEKAANERGLTVATWVLALATGFLFVAAAVQAGLFVWQLDLIRKSLADAKKAADAAEKSADAARLNAEALMVAEAAQMYFIVESDNLKHMFQLGRRYDKSPSMNPSPSDPPWIEYRLRNYGKSPAVMQSVFHGMALEPADVKKRFRSYQPAHGAMEIVGVGDEGQKLRCELEPSFTFGDVRSIVERERLLFFFGRANFMDHFGRWQILDWEYVADKGRWNLITHVNTRRDPDRENQRPQRAFLG